MDHDPSVSFTLRKAKMISYSEVYADGKVSVESFQDFPNGYAAVLPIYDD